MTIWASKIERFPQFADCTVMIASYGHRSFVYKVHDCHYCPLGIGTVADIITEEDCSLGTKSTGLGETRGKRLPISVNICEYRNKHE